jgi:hypothetical protein
MSGHPAVIVILGVLIGLGIALWLYDHDGGAGELDTERAVGLQAGVNAGETATVRWPSWTPRPTNTPRVYPSWTPLPTNTPRWTATRTPTPAFCTPTASATPEPTFTPAPTATLPGKGCEEPWPFTQHERMNIQAAALNHLWREGRREEPMVLPHMDALLSVGLYALDLGAPLTDEFRLESDSGGTIRCRGFALGIVAMYERDDIDRTCRNWAVITWGGEAQDGGK